MQASHTEEPESQSVETNQEDTGTQDLSTHFIDGSQGHVDVFAVSPPFEVVDTTPSETVDPDSLSYAPQSEDGPMSWKTTMDLIEPALPISDPGTSFQESDLRYLSMKRAREHDLKVEKARLDIERIQQEAQRSIEDLQIRKYQLQIDRLQMDEHLSSDGDPEAHP